MRKLFGCLLVLGFALVLSTSVQAQTQVRDEIATERAELQSDRQAIMAANLPLTEDQAKAFWPMYREYRNELQKLGDRLVELILDYAKNDATMTDAQANTMLDEYLSISKDEVKIKSAWAPKFRKVLTPKVVTRFYQIDNKLDVIVRLAAADAIPLVEVGTKPATEQK